ncbi:Glycerate dehydrogenase [Pigmentiphaga humi]|uniref:Glycerate dehydrogenase n=1 Tax=Pigmentiphaga humi TaxID=2478468 RepID=A0A3P4B624_9BURK|nr:2-hydroxyacid dehydrogenase [Pigmentiphaga humi]VCU71361.1 Glycerate dehydrogenase [Pigmentiphaga humi]
MPTDKPALLLLIDDLPASSMARLRERFELYTASPGPGWGAALDAAAPHVRAILVKGGIVAVTDDDMARLPHLGLVSCLGAGFERVDLAAAKSRGIAVTNGSGGNSECVADHAMGLVIAVMREFRAGDLAAREGRWQDGFPSPPRVSGKTLGIAGLGRIGTALARRAEAFRMPVLYCNRSPRDGVPWEYVPDLETLAHRADVLVSVLPGGEATRRLIDRRVLEALGPSGYFVNVGRGNAVDTDELVRALASRAIAGAGLDVLDTEPAVPAELAALPNVLLTPHVGGRSPESADATLELAIGNLLAFHAGEPLQNRVA